MAVNICVVGLSHQTPPWQETRASFALSVGTACDSDPNIFLTQDGTRNKIVHASQWSDIAKTSIWMLIVPELEA